MGKRITSLTEITTVTENDYIPVDNAATGARKLSADFINDLENEIDGKQDALTAGANISITQDGTISATDTTYTAGTNVDITNGVISATDTTYTAGTNITIMNGEISATDTDTLSGLTDTTISSPSDGDALVYDSTSGKWVNGGVASDIGDLNDVDITTPSNGQVLSYDSTSQEWVNTTPSAGSSVSVTQVQSTGTKIATVTVDGTGTDLYTPTPTEVVANPSGTGSTDLTKIDIGGTIYDIPSGGGGSSTLAGLTDVDLDTPTDGQALVYDATNQEWINADVGGGGGGGNLYGITDPTSNLGNNGDIYMKYEGGSEPIEGDWEIICSTETRTTSGAVVMSNFDPTAYKKIKFYGYYAISYSASSANKSFTSSEIDVEDIPAYGETGLVIGSNYVCVTLGQDGNSLYVYPSNAGWKWAVSEIDATPLTVYPPRITNVYGKVENKWVRFPGYSETVLWDDILTPDTSGSNITLSDAVTNYNQLLFVLKPANSTEITYGYFPVSELEVSGTYGVIGIGGYSTYAYFTYNSATSLNIKSWASANKTQYQKIIGIKFGSGSGGGGNLYGTTAPTSEQGSNGDIYMQYTPEGAPVIDEEYTSSVWTGRIFVDSSTEAEITGFDMSDCYYLRVVISDTMDNTISDIPVNEIGVYGENEPYDLQTYRGCFLEKSADGTKLYLGQTGSNQSLISRIDVRRYTQAQTAITDIYGKVENKWVNTRSGSSSLNYSTDEQVVGTWIDGKPLYEITLEYTITNQGATASFDITTDMPITNTARSCETIFEYEYQSEQYSLVNSPAVYYFKIGNTNSIKFNMGSGTVSGDLTVTLRYTKNSD